MDGVKKIRRVFIIIMIVMVTIAVGIAVVTDNIRSKVEKIQFNNNLDKTQLAINEELYNEVADSVTQEEFDNIENIALLGIDDERSDLIIIASINQSYNKIKLITIPRDTYVNVDGYGKIAINQAYTYGQEQLTLKTINSNFGLNISKYVTFDFKGFMNLINAVGGINLEIEEAEMNYINENIHLISGENATMLTKYGRVNLTGEQVLTFIRNRNVTRNYEIEERQKRVLTAMSDKLYEKSLKEIWKSSDYILEQMKTNLNKSEDIALGKDILNRAEAYIKKMELTQVPSEKIGKGQVVDGNYYFECDLGAAKDEFKNVIYEK